MKKIFCFALLGSALFGVNVAQVNAAPITLELIGKATSIGYGSQSVNGPYYDWTFNSINQALVERITFDSSSTYKEDGVLWAGNFAAQVEIYLDGKLSYITEISDFGNYGSLTENSLSIQTAGPMDHPYLDVSINDPILNDPYWFSLDTWTQSYKFKSEENIGSSYILFYEPDYSSGIQLSGTIYQVSLNPSPVPVPGTVWLFGSGLLGLLGFNRKCSKRLAA
jgi:hypothetical protein